MGKNLDLVKKYNTALEKKDIATLEEVLHPSFVLKTPLLDMTRPQLLHFTRNWPFQVTQQNHRFIEQGDTLVQIYDWTLVGPFPIQTRMCEVIDIEDLKISSSCLFYDSRVFPEGAQQMMQQFSV